MTHRQIIKEYLSALILKNKTVIDWGSGSKPVSRYTQNEGCRFITIDKADGIPADRRGDQHLKQDITVPTLLMSRGDIAFCMEVLEHVTNPDQVLENINVNLRDGGTLYLSAPFKYEHHGDEDYWRFTDQGIRLLLERNGFRVQTITPTIDDLGWIIKAVKE